MALMALVVQAANARPRNYDFIVNHIAYYFEDDSTSVSVASGGNYHDEITIPPSVTYNDKAYSVTSIGYQAFLYCSDLTNITIPNTVTHIDEEAFEGCTGLTSVTIPNSVTSIGYYAFAYCTGLTNIDIPESVINIDGDVFYGTQWKKNQPDGIVYAGLVAYCYKGNMPSGTSILLKEGTKGIANRAFWNSLGLTSVTIPNSVTSIGSSAFYGCSGLTSITIPNSVTSIGYYAFGDCSGLTSVTIGNSVTSIGNDAFRECTGMTSVTIGNSVTSIGYDAFYKCTGLTSVTWNAKNCSDFSSSYAPFKGCINIKTFEFGSEVEKIPAYLCYGLTGMTSVTIPGSVTEIGSSAFSSCSLTSVTIGNSVTEIGSYAFSACWDLTSITWNAKNCSDFSSSSYAPFDGCTNIKTFEFGSEVEKIPAYLCYGLTGMTSVTIPNSVTSIGKDAFNGCSGLKNIFSKIEEPANVTMGSSVFYSVPKTTCNLHVPQGAAQKYRAASQWKDFTNIVADLSDGVTGDVNGDGEVNVSDVVGIANYVMGETPGIFNQANADINDNGSVDVSDVVKLANIILGV